MPNFTRRSKTEKKECVERPDIRIFDNKIDNNKITSNTGLAKISQASCLILPCDCEIKGVM